MFPEQCFRKFVVTDNIADLPGAKFYNVVQPAGWFAIGLFVSGVILSKFFTRWVKTHVSSLETSDAPEAAASESAPAPLPSIGALRVKRSSGKKTRAKMVV